MSHELNIEGKKATFTITIPSQEVEEGMKRAAQHLAEHTKIDGFRPGKAPYSVLKERFGEMKILEAAAEELIRNAFIKAAMEENLESVGQPFFNMEKMAPGNDLVFTAELALMPKVKKLADYKKLGVEKKDTEPTKEMVEQARKDLARMQTKEVRRKSDEKLQKGDKAVVNLTMKRDGVVLEGGEGKDHGIYTGEEHYIPGLVDEIVGMKEGESRTFTLNFPEGHYQKHLSGKPVDFEIEMKEVFELQEPSIDDAFAKTVGCEDAADLDNKLKENLAKENEMEEARRQEQEVLRLLAEKSEFEEIPDLLVNQEIQQMIQELKHSISQRGMDFDEYLKSTGKTMDQLKLDMTPDALLRVKIGLVLKEVMKEEDINVEAKEIDESLDRLAKQYEDNEEAKKQIYSPQYREYMERQLKNQKAVAFLKETMVK